MGDGSENVVEKMMELFVREDVWRWIEWWDILKKKGVKKKVRLFVEYLGIFIMILIVE